MEWIEGKITWINPNYDSIIEITDNEKNKKKCKLTKISPILNANIKGYVKEIINKYGKQYEFIGNPEIKIEISIDENSMIKSFKIAITDKKVDQKKIYDFLKKEGNPFIILQKIIIDKKYREEIGKKIENEKIINKANYMKLIEWWDKNQSKIFLKSIGIPDNKIKKMSMYEIMKIYQNPFLVYTLDIEKCKYICEVFNIKYDKNDIDTAKLAREINDYRKNLLWTHVPIKFLNTININDVINNKLIEHNIININQFYTFKYIYDNENQLALWFKDKLNKPKNIWFTPEHWNPIRKLTTEQIDSIIGSLNERCSIITGGAGTGKTTVIGELVKILEDNKKIYVCISFTGKATSRIREKLKELDLNSDYVYTIHLMIAKKKYLLEELNDNNNHDDYQYDDDQQLNGDIIKNLKIPNNLLYPEYIIIDECSMVTGKLLSEFINYFPSIENIILVGDEKQLEPFGDWGRPFLHLINSNLLPSFNLTINHRSQDDSDNGIIINSNNIRKSSIEKIIPLVWTTNFQHYNGDENMVLQIYNYLLNQNISYKYIKILTPFNRDVEKINNLCQSLINPSSKSIIIDHTKFSINDPIIMTENAYNINVMNGEEGFIQDINDDNIIKCNFNNIIHNFQNCLSNKSIFTDIRLLQLSYCLTIHKSQGSEYPIVILYIPHLSQPSTFINRNLIYTAITRAKNYVFCIDSLNEIEESTGVLSLDRFESFPHSLT